MPEKKPKKFIPNPIEVGEKIAQKYVLRAAAENKDIFRYIGDKGIYIKAKKFAEEKGISIEAI